MNLIGQKLPKISKNYNELIKSTIKDNKKQLHVKSLAQTLYVGATLPAAPSVRIAKSRQSSMHEMHEEPDTIRDNKQNVCRT